MKAGKTIVVSDVQADRRMADRAERLVGLGARVIVLAPILDHGRFNLMTFVHHNASHEWPSDEQAFVRSFGDRVQSAIARLQAEADQTTLNREIGHGLKNSFAMVQAIASQTLRKVSERDLVSSFDKRLFALSRAHDILIHETAGASFRAVVEGLNETLAMLGRFQIEGPHVTLGPRGALSLGLLLHELGTNAMKYGALSGPDGVVNASWRLDETKPEAMLVFSWVETGGPVPTVPTQPEFGSKLIRMGLIGTGGVTVGYNEPGFSAEMSASLQQLQQDH